MGKPWKFKCLSCGHDYLEDYDPKAVLTERSCPRCRSNSVRPLAEAEKAKG